MKIVKLCGLSRLSIVKPYYFQKLYICCCCCCCLFVSFSFSFFLCVCVGGGGGVGRREGRGGGGYFGQRLLNMCQLYDYRY